jgi:adenosylcobinamide amidohydrolase
MKKKEIKLKLKNVKAEVLYYKYQNVDVNTLLVSFNEKRRIVSTKEGYREVPFVANAYLPEDFRQKIINYDVFIEDLPKILGTTHNDLAFLGTAANMKNVVLCERSYKDRIVCCLATGGVTNALRAGVDKLNWIEHDGHYVKTLGTINIILLTNVTLTDGAMVRSIITATEAKSAALQDMDARSTVSPELQATGTGTDNMIVVSGTDPNHKIRFSHGHTKWAELVGATTKVAVAETIKKHEAMVASESKKN